MSEIAGFWSYVHDDDKSVGGAIVNLAKRLIGEFELLSAEPLRLFIDRDIQWGEAWKERIDKELQETTFFIPIITPRYFLSEECRRELVEFKTAAARFGVSQLLLPIYYVTVPEMEEREPQDELMAYVKTAQRADMRETRLAEEMDATYRRLVNRLATRLLRVSRDTEGLSGPSTEDTAKPPAHVVQAAANRGGSSSPPPSSLDLSETPSPQTAETVEGEEQEGSLDRLAAGEDALNAWAEAIEELSAEVETLGNAAAESTPEMEAADSFAKQLAVANALARRLEEPSQNIARIAQDYSTHLLTVDPAVQQLIENAKTNEKQRDELRDLFATLLEMIAASREGTDPLVELADGMEVVAGVSRELRPPVRRIQTALRNVRDGQKVLDNWESQINDLTDEDNASTRRSTPAA